MDWDVLSVQAITGQAFANANELTSGQSSRLGSIDKKVIAGATYYVHGWARKTTASGVLTVGLETTAPDGTGTTTTMYTVSTPVTNTWYEYSGEIIVPAGHNLGRCIATATGGTVQYASFYCKPQAVGANRSTGALANKDTASTSDLDPQSVIIYDSLGSATAKGPVVAGVLVSVMTFTGITVASGDIVQVIYTANAATSGALGATNQYIRIERYDNNLLAWVQIGLNKFSGANPSTVPVTMTCFDTPLDTELGWAPSRDYRVSILTTGGAGNGNLTLSDNIISYVRMQR